MGAEEHGVALVLLKAKSYFSKWHMNSVHRVAWVGRDLKNHLINELT